MDCLRVDNTEIKLPVGECGRIHLIDKATKMKVGSRKFLTADKICASNSCETKTELCTFSKNKLSEPILSLRRRNRVCRWRPGKLEYVNKKFYETVLEFVAAEEKKYEVLTPFSPDIRLDEELLDITCTECYGYGNDCKLDCKNECVNFLVFSLYSNFRIEKLLWLDSIGRVSIGHALRQNYGGQAVGNGYRYLVIHHLLPFYVRSNAIIACGYEANEEKWGELKTSQYFRESIQYHDHDFLTFIPHLRPYLHKDVYMKDMKKTMELLSIVFRYIYMYIYLMKRCSHPRDIDEEIRNDLEIQWFFGFYFNQK